MNKRYQVFVSSTIEDLKEERLKVLNALLKISCIPAGMEYFSASSNEQFEYIKRVIDQVDYYILIVAGRYGSIAEDGKSYTEKEFDYALKKDIPILVFIHENPENIPTKYSENNDIGRGKLEKFKNKICRNRLVAFWNNGDELASKVITGLQGEMQVHPRSGWVRNESNSSLEVKKNQETFKQPYIPLLYRNRLVGLSKQMKEMRSKQRIEDRLFNITEDTIEEIRKFCYWSFRYSIVESQIAIERYVPLDSYIQTGVEIDSKVSEYLLRSIFNRESCLRDGAVIIRDNRIVSAGCYLQSGENLNYRNLDKKYQSAIETSRISDGVVITTSSEDESVSIAYNSVLYEKVSEAKFCEMLSRIFLATTVK